MNINQLAHDKALHAIGGGGVSALAMTGMNLAGKPGAWMVGIGAAALAGIYLEWRQAKKNKAAVALGDLPPHDVAASDVIAGVIGGAIVALPPFALWLIT